MRTVRWLASGLAFIALAPSVGAAQSGRLFRDSWFWGANAGIMSFSTATTSSQTATVINGEWFITRSRGGLYISAGQAFFTANASVPDDQGQQFAVQIQDMTQIMADVIVLPASWGPFHLYAGGGFIMNLTHHATITDQSVALLDPAIRSQVEANLNDAKDGTEFNLLVGLHAQLKRVAVFGNLIWMPTPSTFILSGRAAFFLEAGVRLNLGPSEDTIAH